MKENKCILKPNLWLISKQFFEQKTLKKVYYQFISSMYWVFVFSDLIDLNIVEVYFTKYNTHLLLAGLGRTCCNMATSEPIIPICREGTTEALLDKASRIAILTSRTVLLTSLRAL